MAHDLRVLIDKNQIATRIIEMGTEIESWYGADDVVTVVGVLKGSFLFMADLVRAIDRPLTTEFLGVRSYVGTKSSGAVQITHDLRADVADRHVLVVEDIVDTGLTLDYLRRNLLARHPASLRVVSLLDKPSRRQVDVPVDLVGFTIEDLFVVGFGLDYEQRFRNLPHIAVFHGGP